MLRVYALPLPATSGYNPVVDEKAAMAQGKTVLLIDRDPALRGALAEQLDVQGEFATSQASNGAEGLTAAGASRFDLFLVDAVLPDMAGEALCAALRAAGHRSPMILFSPDEAPEPAVAVERIAKPFKLGALLATMRAQLRQHAESSEATLAIGQYTLHPAARFLQDNERKRRRLRLTEKEVALLQYLHGAGGSVVPRDELLARVWGYGDGVSTHTLETHIYRLRQKIERDPATARHLLTEDGGYRLAV